MKRLEPDDEDGPFRRFGDTVPLPPIKPPTNPIVDSGDKGVKSASPCRINWTVVSLPLSQIGPIFSRRSPVEPQPRRFAATVRVAQAAYPLSGVASGGALAGRAEHFGVFGR